MPKVSLSTQSPDTLRNIAKRLVDSAGVLEQVALKMEDNSVTTFEPTHFSAMTIGIKKIEQFAAATRKKMYDVMEARGDFAVAKEDEQPPAKPTKGKKK